MNNVGTVTGRLCFVGELVIALATASCSNIQSGKGEEPMPTVSIEQVLKENTDELMAIPGVVGTAQSLCDGKDCIHVYVVEMTSDLEAKVPKILEGYPVEIQVTGEFNALPEE